MVDISSSTLSILKVINNDYSQLLLLVVAVLTFFFVYKEYVLKRRPFVLPEIVHEEVDGNWFFHVVLVNKGNLPGIAKITNATLTIGDEVYPTVFQQEMVLMPSERQKLAPIGYINKTGREKITGHEYKSNRIEIHLDIESKAIGTKNFRYKTSITYSVDVKGKSPIIRFESEDLM